MDDERWFCNRKQRTFVDISQTDIKGLLLETIRLFCMLDNYALVSSNAMAA